MILKRIEEDNLKAEQIKREKEQLQEIRKGMRIEADLMRSEMMEYFTKIQMNKGSLQEANKMLDEFSKKFEAKHAQLMAMANSDNANGANGASTTNGTNAAAAHHTSPKAHNSSEKKLKKAKKNKQSIADYQPMSESEIKLQLDELTKKQSQELMDLILVEEQKEDERNQTLNSVEDPDEREKLDAEFGILRGIASENIKKLAAKHEKKLVQLEKKLRGIK